MSGYGEGVMSELRQQRTGRKFYAPKDEKKFTAYVYALGQEALEADKKTPRPKIINELASTLTKHTDIKSITTPEKHFFSARHAVAWIRATITPTLPPSAWVGWVYIFQAIGWYPFADELRGLEQPPAAEPPPAPAEAGDSMADDLTDREHDPAGFKIDPEDIDIGEGRDRSPA